MSRKLTTEEFIDKYTKLNKPVEIIGNYINCKTKILCRCILCGEEFSATPDSLMQGKIHKPCAMKLFGESKISTTPIFIQKLEKVNKNIEVLGEYVNAKTGILVKCKICNYQWLPTPNDLLSGNNCPQCSNRIKKSIDELYDDIITNPKNNVTILSPIVAASKKIQVQCNDCGHIWHVTPTSLRRNGCPNCDLLKRTKTNSQFVEEMREINSNILIIGNYINNHTKIRCKCKIDGYEWDAVPGNLLRGGGCPVCNESKGEKICRKYFEDHNIKYIPQKTFNDLLSPKNNFLSYDFYLPDYNKLLEYQGKQHLYAVDWFGGETQLEKQKQYDQIKKEYADKKGYDLIEIWYYDFDNIISILNQHFNDEKDIKLVR